MAKKKKKHHAKSARRQNKERLDSGKMTKKELVLGIINKTAKDHLAAYAAQAAYFLILSFIPSSPSLSLFVLFSLDLLLPFSF